MNEQERQERRRKAELQAYINDLQREVTSIQSEVNSANSDVSYLTRQLADKSLSDEDRSMVAGELREAQQLLNGLRASLSDSQSALAQARQQL